MSLPLDCSRCPKREPGCEDGCREWEKLHWSAINIKRCQYAYDVEHGNREPYSPKPAAKTKSKKKRPVPAEFVRQKQREEEIRRKSEEWETTPEIEAARAAALAKMAEIFAK